MRWQERTLAVQEVAVASYPPRNQVSQEQAVASEATPAHAAVSPVVGIRALWSC